MFQITLALYLIKLSFGELDIVDVTEIDEKSPGNDNQNKLFTSTGMIICFVVTGVLIVRSLTIVYQEEITGTLKQTFTLNDKF